MDLQRHLGAILGRWRAVSVTIGACAGIALVVALMLPSRYTATGHLLIEPQRVDPFTGIALPPPLFSHMPTELDILRSERVAMQVIKKLSLKDDPELQAAWKSSTASRGGFDAWLIERISRPLDAKPSRESNVMTVSYTAASPAVAARMANGFIESYIAVSLQLRSEPSRQYGSYFNETAGRMRGNLEVAQARLSRFQQDNGLVSLDDRLDVESAQLGQLSSKLLGLQAMAASAAGKARQAREGGGLAEMQRDPVIVELTNELGRQTTRLSDLRTQLGESHPSVMEARERTDNVAARLRDARYRAGAVVSGENRMAVDELAGAAAALDLQRNKVLRLNTLRDEARLLQREVENAQRAFDGVLSRSSQANLEGGAGLGNIAVLNSAPSPDRPRLPGKGLILLMGLAVGMLLGVGVALGREFLDRRLRSVGDVTGHLHQVLLARLPVHA